VLVLGRVGQDRVTFFVVLEALVDGPPPPVELEHLHDQGSVVASADEPPVELEIGALKVELDVILSIDDGEQLLQNNGLGTHHELLGLEHVLELRLAHALGDFNLQLASEGVDGGHVEGLELALVAVLSISEVGRSHQGQIAELVHQSEVLVYGVVDMSVVRRGQDVDADIRLLELGDRVLAALSIRGPSTAGAPLQPVHHN